MKLPQLPEITAEELTAVKSALSMQPTKVVFFPHEVAALRHNVYRIKDSLVFEGMLLGSGNWGTTHLCAKFHINDLIQDTLVATKCILKKSHGGFLHDIKNFLFRVPQKMHEEAVINNTIYGESASLALNKRNTVLIAPFLGDLTLDSVLNNQSLLAAIDLSIWFKLFIQLANNVSCIHMQMKLVNNDIKPDNIVLIFEKNAQGFIQQPPTIIATNLIDWGNAHEVGKFQLRGDRRFAPPLSWYKNPRNEKIDIYSLGKTFLHMLQKLTSHPQYATHSTLFNEYHKIFFTMSSEDQANIPSLRNVTLTTDPLGNSVIDRLTGIKRRFDAQSSDNIIKNVIKPLSN